MFELGEVGRIDLLPWAGDLLPGTSCARGHVVVVLPSFQQGAAGLTWARRSSVPEVNTEGSFTNCDRWMVPAMVSRLARLL